MYPRKLMALTGATLALGLVAACGDDDSGGGGGGDSAAKKGGTIKVGFLSDCEGAFGSFFEPTISGAHLALIRQAGAKPSGEKPSDGITGAKVGDQTSRSSATAAPTTPPTRRSRRRGA